MVLVETDSDNNEISPKNAEIEIRLCFERDLIKVKIRELKTRWANQVEYSPEIKDKRISIAQNIFSGFQ